MEEQSIVIGLIIVVIIFIMYNRYEIQKPCDNYVAYFDKMYYELPKLNTVSDDKEQKEQFNDDMELKRLGGQLKKMNIKNFGDSMKTRWSSLREGFDHLENGSVDYTNVDVRITPAQLHHQLKGPKRRNDVAKNHGQQNILTEGFADDEWLDNNFLLNDKYTFDNKKIKLYDARDAVKKMANHSSLF